MKTNLQPFLKEKGYSITKQRVVVFELLALHGAMTMHELAEHAKGIMDRASVYRTINLFERLGIVERLNIGWKYKVELSDTFVEHHHHLSCINCHKVTPINEAELEKFITAIAARRSFKALNHQIEIQGFCKDCQ